MAKFIPPHSEETVEAARNDKHSTYHSGHYDLTPAGREYTATFYQESDNG